MRSIFVISLKNFASKKNTASKNLFCVQIYALKKSLSTAIMSMVQQDLSSPFSEKMYEVIQIVKTKKKRKNETNMLICTSSLKNFLFIRYFLFRLILINNKPQQHRSILPIVAIVVLCCAETEKHTHLASTKKQQRRQKLHESKQKADS